MDILTQTEIQKLVEPSAGWCISLYMPTHRVGREVQQDPIRLKNLLARVQSQVGAYGLRLPQIKSLLAPAERLLDDAQFWQNQSDGLAVFLSKDNTLIRRLPVRFDELSVIANHFHIKPLLPLLHNHGRFYVLALSKEEIRLFQGDRNALDAVDLGNLPTNMAEVLWMDDPEKHVEFHTSSSSPGRGGLRRAAFHGHGGKSSAEKTNLARYFRRIDKSLQDLLEERNLPMVLAGVDYLLPIYHEVSTYPGLLVEGLEGNPEMQGSEDLHQAAWELVAPVFKQDRKEAMERFKQLYGQGDGLAATDLSKVVKAALHGQVEVLFVRVEAQRWGQFDPRQGEVVLDDEPSPQNRDLLDLAAVQTYMHAGEVYALPDEGLPEDVDLAAVLRYAV